MARRRSLLLAPDSFKGTFAAPVVASAMARGVRGADAEADVCPLADGGEGTLDVLIRALGGGRTPVVVHDPLGRAIEAPLGHLEDGSTAIVETACASGLELVAPQERDPERASTYGTGELIAAAVERGAKRVLVAVGGTATTDGGTGAIAAIEAAGGLGAAGLELLCDVATPFERAAQLFAPQKGASPAAARRLAVRLEALAEGMGRDPRGTAMTGAGGGLSGGLWARFGARLTPGAAFVLEAVGFDARARAADAALTGEGRLDARTLEGKLVGEVARRCRSAGTPLDAIVGEDALGAERASAAGLRSVRTAATLAEIEAAARALAA